MTVRAAYKLHNSKEIDLNKFDKQLKQILRDKNVETKNWEKIIWMSYDAINYIRKVKRITKKASILLENNGFIIPFKE